MRASQMIACMPVQRQIQGYLIRHREIQIHGNLRLRLLSNIAGTTSVKTVHPIVAIT